jgi:hypothetical protein
MAVSTKKIILSPLKIWLAEFLLLRNHYHGPTGQPLFSYQVTAHEYEELGCVLVAHQQVAFDYRHEHSWAACFCLYVAECFRREYDGGESGWAWSTFEKRLGCDFTPQQRAHIVTTGLQGYWKRPIRQRERGRDLLGSLFAEGGLPWLLVQSESHGFGRSVRKGIKDYYRTEQAGRTTTDLMSDGEQYLPQTFRNLETRQLLAGIVEQLMDLAERYPLREQSDPADYLDREFPRWRTTFPIPLDETNARGLINEWLKDAGMRRQERKEQEERALAFTCTHRLQGELTDWHILTEVVIPRSETIALGERILSSTRMEICFYEGERLLAREGIVYGQINNRQLTVRFPVTQLKLKRRLPQEPLTMRLLESGYTVHIFHFAYSILEYEDLPLIFEAQGEEWWFVCSTSCSAGSRVRIRMPSQFNVVSGTVSFLVRDMSGALWVESTDSLSMQDGHNLITVHLNQARDLLLQPELQGRHLQYSATPNTIFLGWPRLVLPENNIGQKETLAVYANGILVVPSQMRGKAGKIRYSVRNAQGETILQRRFGILPEEFHLSLHPAMSDRAARLHIRPSTLQIRVVDDKNIDTSTSLENDSISIQLQPVGKEIPTAFSIEISDDTAGEPVVLHLPFPYQGARLIAPDGATMDRTELTLDELIGVRIALLSGLPYGQRFTVQMELINRVQQRLTRRYAIDVGNMPILLNLFSYQNDLSQMLGAVDDQDAYIRMTLEAEKRLLSFNVRRYNGQIRWLSHTSFDVDGGFSEVFRYGVRAAAMLLSDPCQAPLKLPERESEGVETGVFNIVPAMERDAPWLIYPEKDSRLKFRPTIYIPAERYQSPSTDFSGAVKDIRSMHEAARVYHPQHRPNVISEQIAAMAEDFDHSGWQYLADLKLHYSHLPLSTFESWRALASHPEALAGIVLRLEIDEVFCVRMRDELAVIWECIPLPLWSTVYRRFRDWLTVQGLPDVMQNHVLQNRKVVLPAVVSGFQYVDDYLENGDASHLRKMQIELILPMWYQDLRRTHEANDHWPTELGTVLSSWVRQQDLPVEIENLSQVTYSDAVTYLPIFMAYVTAGKAQLHALGVNQAYLKFVIKMVSDFDRSTWYASVHAMIVSYLLASN